jgi:hypothetical protein
MAVADGTYASLTYASLTYLKPKDICLVDLDDTICPSSLLKGTASSETPSAPLSELLARFIASIDEKEWQTYVSAINSFFDFCKRRGIIVVVISNGMQKWLDVFKAAVIDVRHSDIEFRSAQTAELDPRIIEMLGARVKAVDCFLRNHPILVRKAEIGIADYLKNPIFSKEAEQLPPGTVEKKFYDFAFQQALQKYFQYLIFLDDKSASLSAAGRTVVTLGDQEYEHIAGELLAKTNKEITRVIPIKTMVKPAIEDIVQLLCALSNE